MTTNQVLTEKCDTDRSCNLDQDIFKGIFMKNLRYLMQFDAKSEQIPVYKKFVSINIASLKSKSSCMPAEKQCHIVYLVGPPVYDATGPVYDRVEDE